MSARQPLSALLLALGLACCASGPATAPLDNDAIDPATGVPEVRAGVLAGYLAADQLPDSLALLPPPPAPGSAGFAHDQAVAQAAYALRDTPRWQQAIIDADLDFPQAAGIYTCALGTQISVEQTPHTYLLLRRLRSDASNATRAAKNHYQRPRPFVTNQQDLCTPEGRDGLASNGSYPSGHTAIGWAWALVLAELAPQRSNALFVRGRNYAESRLVCNVHWNSDLVAGRHMASAVIARLHAEPAFLRDMAAARQELAAQYAKGEPLPKHCADEAAALATPWAVPAL